MKKRLFFIVNPAAQSGKSKRIWQKLKRHIKYIPHQVYYTSYPCRAKQLALEIISKDSSAPLLIIAVGGDGTINKVINGLIHVPNVTIRFIPTGSGNDFTRGFSLPNICNHIM